MELVSLMYRPGIDHGRSQSSRALDDDGACNCNLSTGLSISKRVIILLPTLYWRYWDTHRLQCRRCPEHLTNWAKAMALSQPSNPTVPNRAENSRCTRSSAVDRVSSVSPVSPQNERNRHMGVPLSSPRGGRFRSHEAQLGFACFRTWKE